MGINDYIPLILLVDEDTQSRQQLTSRLRTNAEINYRIEAGLGGFHALHQLENQKFDLIILMEDFDDMSVIEVVSMARNTMDVLTPILYLSAGNNLHLFAEMQQFNGVTCQQLTSNFNLLINRLKTLLPDQDKKKIKK